MPTLADIRTTLAAPFPIDVIEVKPVALNQEKTNRITRYMYKSAGILKASA